MLKKTITFQDFEGKTFTEDFFFNLTKAELVELEVSEKAGLSETLQELVKEQDNNKIIANFKKIILAAYGQKSEDGRRFIKSDALREEFAQTDAYSELFMELATDPDAASVFITGIMPASLAQEMEKVELPQTVELYKPPAEPKAAKDMTREELLAAMQSRIIPE
jgi:hypothetical protein